MKSQLTVLAFPGLNQRKYGSYSWLLYQGMASRKIRIVDFNKRLWLSLLFERVDIFHVHWPESIYQRLSSPAAAASAVIFIAFSLLLKLRGTKIVWTVHNLHAHDSRSAIVDQYFYRIWTRIIDGLIFLSQSSISIAETLYPQLITKKRIVTPHGHFRDIVYLMPKPGISDQFTLFNLVYVGRIRKYKGLEILLQEFSRVDLKEVRLRVTGLCEDKSLEMELIDFACRDSRIELNFKYIEEKSFPILLEEADLVVVPYSNILNSGSALLALSCNRPCLMPKMGSLTELQTLVGTDWLELYEGPLTAEILTTAIGNRKSKKLSLPLDLKVFDWHPIRESTLEFFRSIR